MPKEQKYSECGHTDYDTSHAISNGEKSLKESASDATEKSIRNSEVIRVLALLFLSDGYGRSILAKINLQATLHALQLQRIQLSQIEV